MAYNPSLYNPYGFTSPVDGLVKVDSIEGVNAYYLPPNSVSPPLFLSSENVFFVKKTDGGGGATIRKFTFEEEVVDPQSDPNYVTKDYLDARINELMEAINGKHPVRKPEPATELGYEHGESDPVVGAVQRNFQPDVQ